VFECASGLSAGGKDNTTRVAALKSRNEKKNPADYKFHRDPNGVAKIGAVGGNGNRKEKGK